MITELSRSDNNSRASAVGHEGHRSAIWAENRLLIRPRSPGYHVAAKRLDALTIGLSMPGLWIALSLAFFLGANLALWGSAAIDVLSTGVCPGGPPDVEPYPCGIFEFLLRMFFSPFALPGQVIIAMLSMLLGAIAYLIVDTIARRLRKRGR